MSIDPDKELHISNDKVRRPALAYINYLSFILLFLLWAFLSRGCMLGGGGGHGAGSGLNGSYLYGTGPGSGDSGEGSGAGEQGSGSGNKQVQGVIGIGSKNSDPGATTKPAKTPDRSQTAGQDIKLSKANANIESIVPVKKQQAKQISTAFGGSIAGRSGIAGGGFYGIKSRSSRTLFVVDISGSMNAPSAESANLRRIDILKRELKKSILDKNRSGGFSIIAFSDRTQICPGKKICYYKEKMAMKRAVKFIDGLSAGGGTGFRNAWNESISIIKKANIDTVFFLTDGFGDADDVYILDLLQKNISDNVVVNCISIGSERPFMKNIAVKRKGKYVAIY